MTVLGVRTLDAPMIVTEFRNTGLWPRKGSFTRYREPLPLVGNDVLRGIDSRRLPQPIVIPVLGAQVRNT
jgi:hypothetical protein